MKTLYTSAFLLSCFLLSAQSFPPLAWVKTTRGTGAELAHDITVDAYGNIYTMGRFRDSTDMDPGPGVFYLAPRDNAVENRYILKLDPAGNLLWAKALLADEYSTAGHSYGGITTDDEGNVYVASIFDGTIDFDPGPGIFELTEENSATHQVFVLKLDAGGNFAWVKTCRASMVEAITCYQNSILIAGTFHETVDFDPGPGEFMASPTASSRTCSFIWKLDLDGNFGWVKTYINSVSPSGTCNIEAITTDHYGNIYAAGRNLGAGVDYDPGPGEYILSPPGMFISKLSPGGDFIYAKTIAGGQVFSMAADAQGNVYVGNVRGIYNDRVFLDKFNETGSPVWSKQIPGFPGPGNVVIGGVGIDPSGKIYVLKTYTGTWDFDPGPGIVSRTTDTNKEMLYISRFLPNGDFIDVYQSGSVNGYISNFVTMHLDISGNVYVTGGYRDTVNFTPEGPVSHILGSTGMMDAFVLKFSPGNCPVSTTSLTVSRCGSYAFNGQTYTQSGVYSHTLINAAGCDSIVTLNLTIGQGTAGLQVTPAGPLSFCTGSPVTLTAGPGYQSYTWSNGQTGQTATINQPGTYTVSAEDAAGCTAVSSTIVINEAPAPQASFTWNQPAGFLVEFSSTSQNGDTYEWIFTDANGQITVSRVENPTFTYLFEGTYPVTFTVTNECGSHTITVNVIVEKRLGMNHLPGIGASIWPNPASGSFFLHLRQLLPEQLNLNIYNLTGQLVHSRVIPPATEQIICIDREEWSGGIYVLQLVTPQGQLNRKILIQH